MLTPVKRRSLLPWVFERLRSKAEHMGERNTAKQISLQRGARKAARKTRHSYGWAEASVYLAEIYTNQRRFAKAESLFREVERVEENPQLQSELMLDRLELLWQAKRYRAAETLLWRKRWGQLLFDVEQGLLRAPVEGVSHARALFCTAVRKFGDAQTATPLERVAYEHPCGATRIEALDGLANLELSHGECVWARAVDDANPLRPRDGPCEAQCFNFSKSMIRTGRRVLRQRRTQWDE